MQLQLLRVHADLECMTGAPWQATAAAQQGHRHVPTSRSQVWLCPLIVLWQQLEELLAVNMH